MTAAAAAGAPAVLVVIVCWMASLLRWFIESNFKCFLRLHSITIDFGCTTRQYWHLYDFDWPTYFSSWVVTGIHGVKAGVSPPRRISPCKQNYEILSLLLKEGKT